MKTVRDNLKTAFYREESTNDSAPGKKRGNATSMGIGILLAMMSIIAWRFYHKTLLEKQKVHFGEFTEVVTNRISSRLAQYEIILKGSEGLFAATEKVSQKDWLDFCRNFSGAHPGAPSLGYAPVVPVKNEGAAQVMAEEGRIDGDPRVPEGRSDPQVPVRLVAPLDKSNWLTAGYDLYSEPAYRAALKASRDQDVVILSDIVNLDPDAENPQLGFLMVNALYRGDMPLKDSAEYRAAHAGFVFAHFQVNELMEGIFSDTLPEINFRIYDGNSTSPDDAILPRGDMEEDQPSSLFETQKTVELYGHAWTFVFTSTPVFEHNVDTFTPYLILGGGLTISFLVFLSLQTQGDAIRRAMSISRRMTSDLHESTERYNQLAVQSRTFTWEVDAGGLYTYISPVVEDVLGYRPEELLGKFHLFDLVAPEQHEKVREQVMSLIESGARFVDEEKQLLTKAGDPVWVKSNGAPLLDNAGQIVGYRGSDNDITQRKRADENRIAREAAETANRSKSIFLSNMSHEIRTPMNAILGFAQVLENDVSLNPKQKEQLRYITRSGRHLLALINDILDMSKIEAGMSALSPSDFNLHDLLDDLELMFHSRAQAKKLGLIMERDSDLPEYVLGDEGKLRQVFVNLIGNAVKFTQDGGVSVRVRSEFDSPPEDHPDQTLHLIVEVEDSGPGISDEDQEKIFEAFKQAEEGVRAGGTGLGLPISRHLVKMQGGDLSLKSKYGTGSCFRFDVRLAPGNAVSKKVESETRRVLGLEPASEPWRVLVVDDVKFNRDLLLDLLTPLGFKIREAENGAEGLAITLEWNPHVVLMDMRMPVMDGYEATRQIKASKIGKNIPVLAVTASAFKDSEDEIYATGVSGYLRKPFRTEELFEMLSSCMDVRFIYDNDVEDLPIDLQSGSITPEQLSGLPPELLRNLTEAVVEGDQMRLLEGIQQVEALDAAVGCKFKELAERYDYAALNEILKPYVKE